MNYLIGLLTGAFVGVALGVTGLTLVDYYERPHCPTEDSCAISYEKGSWEITEVTP